jgi:hypothetical protein
MNRIVAVWRQHRTGEFLIHPFGTFFGQFGHVAIPPYRKLASGISLDQLGSAVVIALQGCRARVGHIRDTSALLQALEDVESKRVLAGYKLTVSTATPAALARRFRCVQVEVPVRYRSWYVRPIWFGSRSPIDQERVEQTVRVGFTFGPAALGSAVLGALPRRASN